MTNDWSLVIDKLSMTNDNTDNLQLTSDNCKRQSKADCPRFAVYLQVIV